MAQQLPLTKVSRRLQLCTGTQALRLRGSGRWPAGQQTPLEVTRDGAPVELKDGRPIFRLTVPAGGEESLSYEVE